LARQTDYQHTNNYQSEKTTKNMTQKLITSLFILFCLNSCKSQSKEELIQFDLNQPKIYFYPFIGELRGKIREITETTSSKVNSPIQGVLKYNSKSTYFFDYDKHFITWFMGDTLFSTMFYDDKWLLDSTKSSNGRVCHLFKIPFHRDYINYCVENGVKSVFNSYKIDLIHHTVSFYYYNRISSIDSFDVKNRRIQMELLDMKGAFTYFKYNNEGDLVGEYVKLPNQEVQLVQSYEYEYDQNKNWIKKINTNRPNDPNAYNTFKTFYERKIIYRSD
jgi:hypothetical protein